MLLLYYSLTRTTQGNFNPSNIIVTRYYGPVSTDKSSSTHSSGLFVDSINPSIGSELSKISQTQTEVREIRFAENSVNFKTTNADLRCVRISAPNTEVGFMEARNAAGLGCNAPTSFSSQERGAYEDAIACFDLSNTPSASTQNNTYLGYENNGQIIFYPADTRFINSGESESYQVTPMLTLNNNIPEQCTTTRDSVLDSITNNGNPRGSFCPTSLEGDQCREPLMEQNSSRNQNTTAPIVQSETNGSETGMIPENTPTAHRVVYCRAQNTASIRSDPNLNQDVQTIFEPNQTSIQNLENQPIVRTVVDYSTKNFTTTNSSLNFEGNGSLSQSSNPKTIQNPENRIMPENPGNLVMRAKNTGLRDLTDRNNSSRHLDMTHQSETDGRIMGASDNDQLGGILHSLLSKNHKQGSGLETIGQPPKNSPGDDSLAITNNPEQSCIKLNQTDVVASPSGPKANEHHQSVDENGRSVRKSFHRTRSLVKGVKTRRLLQRGNDFMTRSTSFFKAIFTLVEANQKGLDRIRKLLTEEVLSFRNRTRVSRCRVRDNRRRFTPIYNADGKIYQESSSSRTQNCQSPKNSLSLEQKNREVFSPNPIETGQYLNTSHRVEVKECRYSPSNTGINSTVVPDMEKTYTRHAQKDNQLGSCETYSKENFCYENKGPQSSEAATLNHSEDSNIHGAGNPEGDCENGDGLETTPSTLYRAYHVGKSVSLFDTPATVNSLSSGKTVKARKRKRIIGQANPSPGQEYVYNTKDGQQGKNLVNTLQPATGIDYKSRNLGDSPSPDRIFTEICFIYKNCSGIDIEKSCVSEFVEKTISRNDLENLHVVMEVDILEAFRFFIGSSCCCRIFGSDIHEKFEDYDYQAIESGSLYQKNLALEYRQSWARKNSSVRGDKCQETADTLSKILQAIKDVQSRFNNADISPIDSLKTGSCPIRRKTSHKIKKFGVIANLFSLKFFLQAYKIPVIIGKTPKYAFDRIYLNFKVWNEDLIHCLDVFKCNVRLLVIQSAEFEKNLTPYQLFLRIMRFSNFYFEIFHRIVQNNNLQITKFICKETPCRLTNLICAQLSNFYALPEISTPACIFRKFCAFRLITQLRRFVLHTIFECLELEIVPDEKNTRIIRTIGNVRMSEREFTIIFCILFFNKDYVSLKTQLGSNLYSGMVQIFESEEMKELYREISAIDR